jgi:hypothetical protein
MGRQRILTIIISRRGVTAHQRGVTIPVVAQVKIPVKTFVLLTTQNLPKYITTQHPGMSMKSRLSPA